MRKRCVNDEEKIIVMVFVLTMASNPFVGLAPFYVAMDKGFFKDCGLDFSMVDFDDSSASCSALLAGKLILRIQLWMQRSLRRASMMKICWM